VCCQGRGRGVGTARSGLGVTVTWRCCGAQELKREAERMQVELDRLKYRAKLEVSQPAAGTQRWRRPSHDVCLLSSLCWVVLVLTIGCGYVGYGRRRRPSWRSSRRRRGQSVGRSVLRLVAMAWLTRVAYASCGTEQEAGGHDEGAGEQGGQGGGRGGAQGGPEHTEPGAVHYHRTCHAHSCFACPLLMRRRLWFGVCAGG
jgi:hypothetical protein